MSAYYNESTKILTIKYVDDNVIRSNAEFNDKNIEIINVEGDFTSTSPDCFRSYSPVYEINLPDSITYIDNSLTIGSHIKSFHIPLKLQNMSNSQPFDWCYALEEFTIDESHAVYAVVDGVLFSKDKKIMYSFPNAKNCKVYQVPHGVEEIKHGCFSQPVYLTHVIIPNTVNKICGLFYGSPAGRNVTIIKCPCENPNATIRWSTVVDPNFDASKAVFKSSMYNETLSSDGKTLIVSPMISCEQTFYHIDFDDTSFAGDKTIETVIFESGIDRISSEAFRGCDKLKRISFANTIKDINSNAFRGCNLGYRSITYSSDSLRMLLQRFSRYALGLGIYSCNCVHRSRSFVFIIITHIYNS